LVGDFGYSTDTIRFELQSLQPNFGLLLTAYYYVLHHLAF